MQSCQTFRNVNELPGSPLCLTSSSSSSFNKVPLSFLLLQPTKLIVGETVKILSQTKATLDKVIKNARVFQQQKLPFLYHLYKEWETNNELLPKQRSSWVPFSEEKKRKREEKEQEDKRTGKGRKRRKQSCLEC
uniref:Uncharacterized protein n=1 Tax=Micrurus corallinus TaxID=54390 RepID=A0A2D4FJJ0_MICCO